MVPPSSTIVAITRLGSRDICVVDMSSGARNAPFARLEGNWRHPALCCTSAGTSGVVLDRTDSVGRLGLARLTCSIDQWPMSRGRGAFRRFEPVGENRGAGDPCHGHKHWTRKRSYVRPKRTRKHKCPWPQLPPPPSAGRNK